MVGLQPAISFQQQFACLIDTTTDTQLLAITQIKTDHLIVVSIYRLPLIPEYRKEIGRASCRERV